MGIAAMKSEGMRAFMARGPIRIDFPSGSLDIDVAPTPEQRKTLSLFIYEKQGKVVVDLKEGDGYKEYPSGTKTEKILSDIDAYFSGQEILAPSLVQQFHSGGWNCPVTSAWRRATPESMKWESEKDIPRSVIWERYDGMTRGPATVEVVKNPSSSDIARIRKEQGYWDEVGALVTRSNTYAFRRDLEFHRNVAKKLGIKEFIGLTLGPNYAMVTDATTKEYKHKQGVSDTVRSAFPQVEEVSYYDEDIVGDWENLEETDSVLPAGKGRV